MATQIRVRSFVAVLSLALLACASDDPIPVSSSYDPLYDFPQQATFAWDERANVLPDNPDIDRKATDALVRELVGEAFAARGYRLGGPDAPYRLSYEYAVNRRTSADESFAMGTLSLILSERASRRRLWTGFGRAEIYQGLTDTERRDRLRGALDRMLVNFPPSQRPKD